VNRLTKWSYFIICIEKILVENVIWIYIKKVFIQHGAPKKIILDW